MTVNLAIIVLAVGIPLLAFTFYVMAKTPEYSDIHETCYYFSVVGGTMGIVLVFASLMSGITVDLSKLVQFRESPKAQETPKKPETPKMTVSEQYDMLAK